MLLQKATKEPNDNKTEHLWECSVDPNPSQLSICPKSPLETIERNFPSGFAHERGNFLESLIDLPGISRILRNLSMIPKSTSEIINVKRKEKSLLAKPAKPAKPTKQD